MDTLKDKYGFSIEKVYSVGYIEYQLRYKDGKTPKGYSKKCGYLLINEKVDGFVEDVQIDKKLRGLGIGKGLYEYVLNDYGVIQTNYHKATKEAQNVWDSLIKKYNHETDFFSGRLKITKTSCNQLADKL